MNFTRRNLPRSFPFLGRTGCLVCVCVVAGVVGLPILPVAGAAVSVTEQDGALRVEIDGALFTEYHATGFAKPILYPVLGPKGIGMTRNYPMQQVPGEARDHVHHKSLWYTHGAVNGTDFWGEGAKSGKIVQTKLLKAEGGAESGCIQTANSWRRLDGTEVCSDTRLLVFHAVPGGKAIDFEITITASKDDVVFGDTKEGTMGIRTHPNLRLRNDARQGVTTANGHGVNSEGVRDGAMWGKRASWVDYWGTIDGMVVGVGIFDHPSNPRHPTWWHARDYGLVAANPFGIHDFEKKPAGTGDLKIPAGESRTWRYRFVFHEGDAEKATIAALYEAFAAQKGH